MSPWEVLQLEATDDVRLIKRAYAKQLKIHHPEDDPEGYQQLREAYEYIMARLRQQATTLSTQTLSIHTVSHEENEEAEEALDEANIVSSRLYLDQDNEEVDILTTPPRLRLHYENGYHTIHQSKSLLNIFIEDFISLYQYFPSRINLKAWEELFDSDICWDLQQRRALNISLIELLHTHRYLPKEVWFSIERFFELKPFIEDEEQALQNEYEYLSNFYSFYVSQFYEPSLSYDGLLGIGYNRASQFVELREQGYRALQANELISARDYLSEAYELFSQDQDVIRLFIECELRLNHIESALALSEELIDLAPRGIDGYLYKAKLLYIKQDYTEAASVYQQIKIYWPDCMEAKRMIAECFIHMKQELHARNQLTSLHKTTSDSLDGHTLYTYSRLFQLGLIKVSKPQQTEIEQDDIYGLDDVAIPSEEPTNSNGGLSFQTIIAIILFILWIIRIIIRTNTQ